MDSIRVTKPNMGTLDPQRPALSPFGALAQAFAQELIDRAEPGEGRYSRAALDFLEEPAGAEPAPAQTRQDIRLDVQVILNALRREEGGWHQAEERLLARLDRLQKEQEKRPLSHTAVNIRQSFYQTVWQHASPKADGSPAAPGRLGRSAERFSGQVRGQTARPAQKSVPGNVWSENAPAGRAPALPNRTPEGSIPPQRTPFSHAELTLPEPAEPTTQTAVEPVRRMAERTAQAALDRAAERVRAAAEREKRNDPRVEAKASAEKPTSQRPGRTDAANAPESGAAARQTAKTAAAKAKRDGAAQNTGTKATARADGMKATPQAGEPAVEKPTQTNAAKAATQADSAGRMPNAAQVSGVRTEAAAGRAAGPQAHTIQTASGRDIRTANLTPAAAEAPTERAVRPVETEYAPQPGAAGAADAANAPEGGAAARQTAKTAFAQPGAAPLSSTAHPQAGASGPHSAGPMLSRESTSAPQTAGSAAAHGQMPGLAGMEAAMVNGPELALRAEREDVPQSAGAFPPISTPSAEPSAKRAVRPTELGHASRTGLARPTGDIRTFRPRTKQPVTERAAERLGGGPELTYRQTAEEPVRPAPQEPEESEYVRKLPDWARRFLRSSAGQGGTVPSAPVKQPTPAGAPQGGEQIRWTAPAYAPPEPMELREKTRPARQETPAAPPQLSQAELERAADQVYRMIEDRIRRERRRMGL